MDIERNFFELVALRCEDNENAYQFPSPTKNAIGHLTSLSINGQKIEADLTAFNPLEMEKQISAVGFFLYAGWEGKPSNSLSFTFKISEKNNASFLEALCSSQDLPEIEAAWTIYAYDKSEKKFFKRFYTNNSIVLTISNGTRIISDYRDKNSDLAPFNFSMCLAPPKDSKDQDLFVSFKSNGKIFQFPIKNTHLKN